MAEGQGGLKLEAQLRLRRYILPGWVKIS